MGLKLNPEKLDITELQGTIDEIVKDKCRRAADIVGYIDFFNPVLKVSKNQH
jgi:hypothetical protein